MSVFTRRVLVYDLRGNGAVVSGVEVPPPVPVPSKAKGSGDETGDALAHSGAGETEVARGSSGSTTFPICSALLSSLHWVRVFTMGREQEEQHVAVQI